MLVVTALLGYGIMRIDTCIWTCLLPYCRWRDLCKKIRHLLYVFICRETWIISWRKTTILCLFLLFMGARCWFILWCLLAQSSTLKMEEQISLKHQYTSAGLYSIILIQKCCYDLVLGSPIEGLGKVICRFSYQYCIIQNRQTVFLQGWLPYSWQAKIIVICIKCTSKNFLNLSSVISLF